MNDKLAYALRETITRAKMRADRKRHCVCLDCGRQAAPERVHCRKCLRKRSDREKRVLAELRAERKAEGLCPSCGDTPQEGRIYCATCLQSQKELGASRRASFAIQGLCTNCGAQRDRINTRTGKTALQCSTCARPGKRRK